MQLLNCYYFICSLVTHALRSDSDCVIDTGVQAAQGGHYHGLQPMGLFANILPHSAQYQHHIFSFKDVTRPHNVSNYVGSILCYVGVVALAGAAAAQSVGSISSRTLSYDCLCTLEVCTTSMIATSSHGDFWEFFPSVCLSCS